MDDDKVKNVKEEKAAELVPVRVIASGDNSALVEFTTNKGYLTRATVTMKQLSKDNEVSEPVLSKAVRYGIDWSELEYPKISPDDICQILRSYGVWTADDVRAAPLQVSRAVMQACAPIVKTILEFIQNK